MTFFNAPSNPGASYKHGGGILVILLNPREDRELFDVFSDSSEELMTEESFNDGIGERRSGLSLIGDDIEEIFICDDKPLSSTDPANATLLLRVVR